MDSTSPKPASADLARPDRTGPIATPAPVAPAVTAVAAAPTAAASVAPTVAASTVAASTVAATASAAPAAASAPAPTSASAPASSAFPASSAPALRASDQDRDQVAAALGEALATGRLTSTEHAERIEAAYSARTLAELVPLTADLPAARSAAAPAATVERQQVTAVFSKVLRGGRWVAGRHTELRSNFGALIVDMSDAVLPGREIELEVNSFCGKLIVTLPANAQIIDEGGVLFGKRWVAGGRRRPAAGSRGPSDAAATPGNADADRDEDGPVIRVTGQVRFGKVVIQRAGGSTWRWPWQTN